MCLIGRDARLAPVEVDDLGSAVAQVRRGESGEDVPVRVVSAALLRGSSPWRTFGSRKGQGHYPGAYWSAVTGGHVPYESRLELSFLLFADREPGARAIYAQPFRLVAAVGGRIRRHVPDFLVEKGDGGLTVVDVKPRRRLGDDGVRFTFGWTAGLAERLGWGFEVFSEQEPGVLANVRFLSGYRRDRQFDPAVLEEALSLAGRPLPLADLEAAVAGVARSWPAARAHVLHLVWSGRLRADLGRPLSGSTWVECSR
jgi:hypothetical protein